LSRSLRPNRVRNSQERLQIENPRFDLQPHWKIRIGCQNSDEEVQQAQGRTRNVAPVRGRRCEGKKHGAAANGKRYMEQNLLHEPGRLVVARRDSPDPMVSSPREDRDQHGGINPL